MAPDDLRDEPWNFERFFAETEPPLRRALIARFGPQRGREATAEALAFAWERPAVVRELRNPVAYLFAVGRSRTRPTGFAALIDRSERDWLAAESSFEPGLAKAVSGLSSRQRTAVILVVGYRWTFAEVAELMHVRRATVQRHVERGLRHLRGALGVALPGPDSAGEERATT
jgi:DNA-directed RNA polymerase specialized sigma24 family protein